MDIQQVSYIKGFTTLELLIVIAIMGILAAVAMPSFMDTIGGSSVNGAVKSFTASINAARSEAITRGTTIHMCPKNTASTDCAAASWSNGWIIFVDNNNDATGATGSIDITGGADDDVIIQVVEPVSDVVLTSTAPATNLLRYDGRGFGQNTAVRNFKFCPEDNDASNALGIEINITGRARLVQGGLACP